MTEIDYHVKVRVHWGVFVFGVFLIIVGVAAMFAMVKKQVYVGTYDGYNYYSVVPTYPFFVLGVILETVGWIVLIASFFVGEH